MTGVDADSEPEAGPREQEPGVTVHEADAEELPPRKRAKRIVSFIAEPEVVCADAGSDNGEPEDADAKPDEDDGGGGGDDGDDDDEEDSSPESEGCYESEDDSEGDGGGDGGEGGAALAAGLAEMPKGLLQSLLSGGKLGGKPLHAAAAAGDVETLEKLLATEFAGSVDDLDPFEYTPLHVAAESGSKPAVVFLLNLGADVEKQTKMHCSRPIHYAAFEGHREVCQALLEGGCDPDARTDDLRTPLYQASFRGRTECVKVLLDAGADREVMAKDGKRAVDIAANDAVRELLEQPLQKKNLRVQSGDE